MSSAQPDDFNEYGATYESMPSPERRVFEVERVASVRQLDERRLRSATETRAMLIYEFERLRAEVRHFVQGRSYSLVGPVTITVEIRAEGQAISDAAGLDESQRDSVYESGLRQVVIDVSR